LKGAKHRLQEEDYDTVGQHLFPFLERLKLKSKPK
jgi:hypothetical protein